MSTKLFARSAPGYRVFIALLALATLLGACVPVTLTPVAVTGAQAAGTVEASETVPPPATSGASQATSVAAPTAVPAAPTVVPAVPTVVASVPVTGTVVVAAATVTTTVVATATATVTTTVVATATATLAVGAPPGTPVQAATTEATVSAPGTPTATPPPPAPAANIAVQLPDNSVQMVDASGTKTLLFQAPSPVDLASIFPPGNVVSSTLYLPLSGTQARVVAVSPGAGPKRLDWMAQPVYGLAASPAWLAWATGDVNTAQPASRIILSKPDGSGMKTAVEQRAATAPRILRAMRWSADGKRLFFGREPIGIGGYILFSGLSNLWAYDLASDETSELLHEPTPNAAVCIDDLSPNEQLAADHCQNTAMEVTNLATGQTTAIPLPANVPEVGAVGGARFNPDSTRLAYGLARRNPDNEQGWVALADLTSGTSTLIATSPANDYFSVVAWLDPDTVLLQSAGAIPGVWTLDVNGGVPQRLTDGTFVGLLPANSQVGEACGNVQMQGLNKPSDPSAKAALDCFWQAYQKCEPASLSVTIMEVDAGATNQFSLGPGGAPGGAGCQVQDRLVRYVVTQPTPAPQTLTCQGLVQQDGGLLFQACGDQGDILVPGP